MRREDIERGNFILELKRRFQYKYNIAIMIYIIIFVSGYTFFFSSNIWMKKDTSKIVTTPFNSVQNWNNNEMTLLKWDFSPKSKEMEIILNLDNTGIDEANYQFSATYMSSVKKYPVEQILSKEHLVVLRLRSVPNKWGAVRIDIFDGKGSSSIFASDKSVSIVENIETKTFNEYMVIQLETTIKHYNDLIENNYERIDKNNKIIDDSYAQINEIFKTMEYQTDKQKDTSQQKISSLLQKVSTSENAIKDIGADSEEYVLRILNVKRKLKKYIGE